MDHFEVVSVPGGHGLIATRDLRDGERVSGLRWAATSSAPTRWTVQVGRDLHADPLPEELRYLNHSCEPTVWLDFPGGAVRAKGPVPAGSELTFFYPATEWQMAEPFACRCGTSSCLGLVAGAVLADRAVLRRHALGPGVLAHLTTLSSPG